MNTNSVVLNDRAPMMMMMRRTEEEDCVYIITFLASLSLSLFLSSRVKVIIMIRSWESADRRE